MSEHAPEGTPDPVDEDWDEPIIHPEVLEAESSAESPPDRV